jgi:hypothetical protein
MATFTYPASFGSLTPLSAADLNDNFDELKTFLEDRKLDMTGGSINFTPTKTDLQLSYSMGSLAAAATVTGRFEVPVTSVSWEEVQLAFEGSTGDLNLLVEDDAAFVTSVNVTTSATLATTTTFSIPTPGVGSVITFTLTETTGANGCDDITVTFWFDNKPRT